jgi:hypothetical protein
MPKENEGRMKFNVRIPNLKVSDQQSLDDLISGNPYPLLSDKLTVQRA